MRRYFVFRVHYDDDDAHKWIMDELFNNGRLRQGWGKRELQLIEADGTKVDRQKWIDNYKSLWNVSDDEIWRRYDILLRMLEISAGDYIVIPKTRDNYTLTICEANDSYCFDNKDKTFWNDFKHIIDIKNPRSYKYTSYDDAKLIASKFKAYQSAVNNVWQSGTKQAIESLYMKEESDQDKTIKDLTDDITKSAIKPIVRKLLDIEPNYFEDIIAKCLESRGYEIIGRRKYDGRGADVDIVASFSLPYFSEMTDQSPTLLIQIKKKKGTDWNDVEGVKQLINSGKDHLHPIKILMNTTDTISQEAAEMAAMHGIKIIYGLHVIDFILKTELKSI